MRLIAAFLAGVLVTLLGAVLFRPVQAQAMEPTIQILSATPLPTASAIPTATATAVMVEAPTIIPSASPMPSSGVTQCFECTSLTAKVKLSHYNPAQYDPMYPQLNCWNYSEEHKWCLSPVWIGVPWESGWNLFAACADIWAVGTWVEVPGVGSYLCVDHGYEVGCNKDGVCQVDVLGQGGAWDGKTFDATLWVPKSFLIRFDEAKEK